MNSNFSISERHGLEQLTETDLEVYSVGISTGGTAEIEMAGVAKRHIVATTIDWSGMEFARTQVQASQLEDQIECKLEDVSADLPYPDNYFDYIYARLVLHYMPEDKLISALSNLHRVLKSGSRLFVVVRSDTCEHAHMSDSTYDPGTKMTEYTEYDSIRGAMRLRRHFFSEEELSDYVSSAGFTVSNVESYDERLFKDFERTVPDTRTDNLVELTAIK